MRVTYYYPWGFFYPVNSGAAAVAMQHMEYFRSRGFKVRIVIWGDDQPSNRLMFERRFGWLDELYILNSRRDFDFLRIRTAFTFHDYLNAHVAICDLPEFRKFISADVDLLFLNYIFSAPFLDLAPRNAARVVESVDIMSKQFLLGRNAPLQLARDLSVERDLYALFDLVLMISQAEAEFMQARSSANIEYVPRGMERLSRDAVLEADGETFDLLFVGCPHPPNAEGVHWFYEEVFAPHLKPHGLRWAIAGTIGEHLRLADENVHILGRVDDLNALYRRSKVVIVPIFNGEGISIKTLEALSRGKPVVSTPIGARGISGCDECMLKICFKSAAEEVARRILELTRSRQLREEYGRKALEYIESHFSREKFYLQMDNLLMPLLDRTRRLCA
ncbi:MAG TPA: glycosyltransferase family 4 protein [Pirellulales bacterium]|nr:glycosyltransferase family 4 protein [Pirellulales bacterium]